MAVRSILHVSDIHLGPPHEPAAALALARLVCERTPTLLVVAGDLTQRAKRWQFVQARQLLQGLAVPSLTVPGNHDVPMYRFWERFGAPYGAYRRYFSSELEPTWRDDGLVVIGVNTAHNLTRKHGRVRTASLERARRLLQAASRESARVVVAHHPLFRTPHFPGERAARGAERAARTFAEEGVDLVLSGHVHRFLATRAADQFVGLPGDFGIVHCGTTTSNRGRPPERHTNSCAWIEIDTGELRIESLYREAGERDFRARESWCWPRSRRTEAEERGAID